MEKALSTLKQRRELNQHERLPRLEAGSDEQTEIDALYNKVHSNMNVQQINLNKLAARENQEKGFGNAENSNEVNFKELLERTEEILRLLYAERMRPSEKPTSNSL